MAKYSKGAYFITSAQAVGDYDVKRGRTKGAPNKRLLTSIKTFLKHKGAELSILTMNGKDATEQEMHPELTKYYGDRIIRPEHRNRKLNSNVAISDMVVPPQNVDPATGRARFVQTDTSLVYAHSKQRLKAVPSSNAKLPKLLATTGAVTYPNYNEHNHRGDVAAREHAFGGVVIEVIDDEHYNLRHIGALGTGKFVDMGWMYDGDNSPTKAKTTALVLGDIHLGDHDPKTMAANYEMIEGFKPKMLVLHDFFNGHSITHHEKNDAITRAINFERGRLGLEEELKTAYQELCHFSKAMGRGHVYVVACNHHRFVQDYLQDGRFINEPWNAKVGAKLATAMIDGTDPVEAGIKMMGKVPKNVSFLEREDDLKVWGFQLASHGDKGLSGSRVSSAASREIAHGKSITGHSHAPEILRKTIIVGTSTKLVLPYTIGGANSWMAANAVIYDNGLAQLVPIIDGKWKGKN